MNGGIVTATVELFPMDSDGFLFWERMNADGSICCPLTNLIAFLEALSFQGCSSQDVIEQASELAVMPSWDEAASLLLWPEGLQAVLCAARGFLQLGGPGPNRLATAAFAPLAPVLRSWHADLGEMPAIAPGKQWLDRCDLTAIIAIAERRDCAALEIIAGRARREGGDVMSLLRMSPDAS